MRPGQGRQAYKADICKTSPNAVKKFMDRRLLVNVQGNRRVTGLLRGFDIFLNIVLDDARDETVPGREENLEGGPVVRVNKRMATVMQLLPRPDYLLSSSPPAGHPRKQRLFHRDPLGIECTRGAPTQKRGMTALHRT